MVNVTGLAACPPRTLHICTLILSEGSAALKVMGPILVLKGKIRLCVGLHRTSYALRQTLHDTCGPSLH
jgi:hypothetical protein